MAEVGGDDKQVIGVGEVLAKKLAVLLLAAHRQRPHQHRHDGELTCTAETQSASMNIH